MSAFPQPWRSTVSHWHATDRADPLWNHNRDVPLSRAWDGDAGEVSDGRGASVARGCEADILVVGGGMTGAALAYFLTRGAAGKRIICVDAKDCGSGATGRNGGHVGPKTYLAWNELMQAYPLGGGLGAEEAVRITQSERDNLDLVERIVREEWLDVDFWRGELLETHHSKEETDECKRLYAEWLAVRKKLGLGGDDTRFIDDAEGAEKLARMKGVTSVHVRPAGSVHSHKLCAALLRAAMSPTAEGCRFRFFSWAPVSSLEEHHGGWKARTARGDISAKQVVLCTNAHTPHLFPKSNPIHHHIQPFRGQCATITPPTTYSGLGALKHTYNTTGGHYLVTAADGQMVLGGGVAPYIEDGRVPVEWYTGAVDDSAAGLHPVLTKDLAEFMPGHFHGWGPEAHGEGLTREWVGIMASSRDGLPLVGGVPGMEGVYIAAGFSGHGMSRIFVTARGLAHTLCTGEWDARLPRAFEVTAERLRRAQEAKEAYERDGRETAVVDGLVVDLKALRRRWWKPWG